MQRETLKEAYSPEQFRAAGHHLVDQLADHLTIMFNSEEPKVLPWQTPDQAYQRVKELVQTDAQTVFKETLANCIRLHHPHFIGHQISPPLPTAALAGLLADLVNNGMGVYEMGTIGTAFERYVIKTVAHQFGMGEQADGVLTSGGSLGNLTALLAARRSKSSHDVWNEGNREPLAVMVSEQAHYCVDRAARVMGWGEQGVVRIPVDDDFRMDTQSLGRHLQQSREAGQTVIAVIGSACSTATGSFDDLNAIADFCEANDLWFHVDGAHGAAVSFSEKHRHLVAGIERADSAVLDFHKLLMTPALATAIVFREGHNGYQAFAQKAQYLWSDPESETWYELARRTFECTKTMYGLKVFSIIAEYGTSLFEANVDSLHALSVQFAQLINDADDFELLIQPQTNIVCFRFLGEPMPSVNSQPLNELNQKVRTALIEEGRFYIVQTDIEKSTWLRTTLANSATTLEDLRQLLERIRGLAQTN